MIKNSICLHPADNIEIALRDLKAGDILTTSGVATGQAIARGHKIATAAIPAGGNVLRYGQIIGQAKVDIAAGDHIHVHNLGMGEHAQDYAFASANTPLPAATEARTFMGYKRADGKVGTRNYIGILTTVNCSGSVARFITEAAEKSGFLDAFPNVDGIVPISHGTGCGMSTDGEGYATLFRTLSGYAQNPNFGGILLVGLGCEVMQIPDLVGGRRIRQDGMLRYMTIQQEGGTRKTIERGLEELRGVAEFANRTTRTPAPVSEITIGMQCGGSDGYSTTILEKSLGAVAKGGTAPLLGVYKFGEKIDRKGFVFMDSPGFDPCSVTGQVASGANLIVFTTGRGSVSGYKPTPCIKISTNSEMYERMKDDMDLNCGDIVTQGVTIEEKGKELFELIIRVASGEQTKSEELGYGGAEFVPWQIGAVM